jgi:hypothetical protein
LCHKWRQNPEKFFEPWSLTGDADDSTEIVKPFSFKRQEVSRSSEDSIRIIFHAVFFRDTVLAQASRRKKDAKLPRAGALSPMVKRAWTELTGKALSEAATNELVKYVIKGNDCVELGKKLGRISWLLCPTFVLER